MKLIFMLGNLIWKSQKKKKKKQSFFLGNDGRVYECFSQPIISVRKRINTWSRSCKVNAKKQRVKKYRAIEKIF